MVQGQKTYFKFHAKWLKTVKNGLLKVFLINGAVNF